LRRDKKPHHPASGSKLRSAPERQRSLRFPVATAISIIRALQSPGKEGGKSGRQREAFEEGARKLALAAVARMKPLPKDEQNPLADRTSHDDPILWLTCKEAKATIQFDAAPTAATSK
jgi:hypothetical protein